MLGEVSKDDLNAVNAMATLIRAWVLRARKLLSFFQFNDERALTLMRLARGGVLFGSDEMMEGPALGITRSECVDRAVRLVRSGLAEGVSV